MTQQASLLPLEPAVQGRKRRRTTSARQISTSAQTALPASSVRTGIGGGWVAFVLADLAAHVRGYQRGHEYRFICAKCRVPEQAGGYSGRLLERWFDGVRERHRHTEDAR